MSQQTTPTTKAAGKPKRTIRVSSVNIDTNIGRSYIGPGNKTHPHFSPEARRYAVSEAIAINNPDVVLVQEARECLVMDGLTNKNVPVSTVKPTVQLLEDLGYVCKVTPYNPSEMAFVYITAVRGKEFEFEDEEEEESPYVTTDRRYQEDRKDQVELKKHNYGEAHERRLAVTRVWHRETGKSIALVNVHLGLGLASRMAACTVLGEIADKYPCMIAAGDFNSIQCYGGAEQMDELKKVADEHGFVILSAPEGTRTFVPCPFDLCERTDGFEPRRRMLEEALGRALKEGNKGAEELRTLTDAIHEEYRKMKPAQERLDHFLVKGLATEGVVVQVEPLEYTTASDHLDRMIARGAELGLDGPVPITASDHLLVCVDLSLDG